MFWKEEELNLSEMLVCLSVCEGVSQNCSELFVPEIQEN